MRSRFVLALLGGVFLLACGGKIADEPDGGDASTDGSGFKDVTILPDTAFVDVVPPPKPDASPPVTCSTKTGQGYVGSDGQCGEIDDWTCSDKATYEISCKCPADGSGNTCACRKNGITTLTFAGPVCPGCTGVAKLASQCGFPE